MKAVRIFIDGAELMGWTQMSLTRSKDELTGSLNVSIFVGFMPSTPMVVNVGRGRSCLVYIGSNLAFVGTIDRRRGTGARTGEPGTDESDPHHGESGSDSSISIGPNEYTIQLTARGTLKGLIDSSHQHETSSIIDKPTTSQVVRKLVEPWGTPVEWLATDVQLDKVRLRDGARVVDELHRICLENCYYMYETRDGRLRVTDDIGPTVGEPIVLGVNVLSFSAEQSEDKSKSKIKVKGQRTQKDVWGKDAVEETIKDVEDQWVGNNSPVTVQHYGDATPESLERRARFEANKRSSASKQVSIDVFHVQTPSGTPWDVGQLHYVEIPPEGIFDVFECTAITYTVSAEELKTSLTLSPPPSMGFGMPSGGGIVSLGQTLLGQLGQYAGIGRSRRAAAGVTFAAGSYPQPWSGPNLLLLPLQLIGAALPAGPLANLQVKAEPALTLPRELRDD